MPRSCERPLHSWHQGSRANLGARRSAATNEWGAVQNRPLVLPSQLPVPVNPAVCGLSLALSLTFRVAVRVPVAVGAKVTEMVQWDFAARLPPQVFVGEPKSLGSAPVNVMLLIVNAVERLLVSVTVLAALVVPAVCAANAKEVGETVACAVPVPDNEAV